jgi:6-phosphogluconate dehydrogenase
LAYGTFEEIFTSDRWRKLEHRGATVQRPLWASTGVKDPAYPDTMYVDSLIAPQTVNTMPLGTLRAVADHGHPDEGFSQEDVTAARSVIAELERVGIRFDEVTDTIERERLDKFSASFQQIVDLLTDKLGSTRVKDRGVQIGIVGLGRMGSNMTRRLLRDGHDVVAFDVDHDAVTAVAKEGATSASSLQALVDALEAPRVVWVMVPAGSVTEATLEQLGITMDPDDTVVDGGNSRYTDSVARAAAFDARGISFVDAGTSGGVWGLENGYTLMVGADPDVFARIEPVLATLSPENGYARVGSPGAGHFVKMVHNGIEYALMAAYAEGFNILAHANAGAQSRSVDAETTPLRDPSHFTYDLPIADIAELWRRGSVIRSWLLDLTAAALAESPALEHLAGHVSDSGEGRWTAIAAVESGAPAPMLTAALFQRFSSRGEDEFARRLLSAMRLQFGGHRESSKKDA